MAKTNSTKKYHELYDRLSKTQADLDIWAKRAIYAEKKIEQLEKRNAEYLGRYYDKVREVTELEEKLPSGSTLIHIENLIRLKEAYRDMLIGERIGFGRKLRLFWLILKGYR